MCWVKSTCALKDAFSRHYNIDAVIILNLFICVLFVYHSCTLSISLVLLIKFVTHLFFFKKEKFRCRDIALVLKWGEPVSELRLSPVLS